MQADPNLPPAAVVALLVCICHTKQTLCKSWLLQTWLTQFLSYAETSLALVDVVLPGGVLGRLSGGLPRLAQQVMPQASSVTPVLDLVTSEKGVWRPHSELNSCSEGLAVQTELQAG